MLIDENYVDLETSAGNMRTFLFQPKYQGSFPSIILYSEIYQVTGPIQRIARMLASHGYMVAAPEIYHEFEPLGSPFAYDTAGTDKGNRLKVEKNYPNMMKMPMSWCSTCANTKTATAVSVPSASVLVVT